jgi:M6 family metalloprotease-like protein
MAFVGALMLPSLLSELVPGPARAESSGPFLRLRPGLPSQSRSRAEAGYPAPPSPAGGSEAAQPDTLRLLVLLAEFPADDDPATTGDGRFEREPSDAYEINRPPHDHAYFDRQCRAVRSYFDAATSRRLAIEWRIVPDPPGTFELPHPMRYYNPDTTEAALERRLAEFFRDAIETADAAGVPFSSYDAYAIFHAGVGQDLAIDDETRSDIPSAFLSFEELRDALDEDGTFDGIPVQNGTSRVREGLWLPETENQEGFAFALTGVFAQLLGSQLGLPILWNPNSGAPGIGRFGLMDQGAGNLEGKVPALPDAWSRFDRGWADSVLVLQRGEDVEIRAAGAAADGVDLIVIPVDEREYFLVENRKKDRDGDGRLTPVIEATVPIGVVADEYDYGIPGSGLLIWHIDQAVIDSARAENAVNGDPFHRGVKLLEADGLDDIGLRPNGGFGLPEDAYFEGNATELTSTSNPSSASNYGASTHVFVTGVSDTGLVMRCDVGNAIALPGWPDARLCEREEAVTLCAGGTDYDRSPLAAGDVDGDGDAEIVAIDGGGRLDVFGPDGAPESTLEAPGGAPTEFTSLLVAEWVEGTCAGCEEILVATNLGEIIVYDALFDTLAVLLHASTDEPGDPAGEIASLSIGHADLDAVPEVVAVRGDSVFVWASGGPMPGSPFESPLEFPLIYAGGVGDAIGSSGPMATPIVLVSETGEIALVSLSLPTGPAGWLGATGYAPASPPVFGDLDRSGSHEVIYVTTDARLVALHITLSDGLRSGAGLPGPPVSFSLADGDVHAEPLAGWPVTLDSAEAPPALGDIDGDGYLDVVVGAGHRLRAFARNGVRLHGWPVAVAPGDAGVVRAEPLIADIDGDGAQEVLLASPDGLVRAYTGDGRALEGWPVPAGRTHVEPGVVTTVGGGALVQPGPAGWLYAFTIPDVQGAHWPMSRGDAGRSGVFDTALLPESPPHVSLPPEDRFSVYPNPAHAGTRFRFYLDEAAEVEVTIYDLSGAEVRRLEAAGLGGAVNEIAWSLENSEGEAVAPGLYVARVTARGAARSIFHETKIAVVR